MKHERHILVLGASGKLGRMLWRHWRAAPVRGQIMHWQCRENPAGDADFWQPGAAIPASWAKTDTILALWGVTPGPERDLAENRRLGLAAMELGAALGARRVLHCSSAAVYEPGPAPLGEDSAGGAINAYGAAKLAAEQAVADWAAVHREGPRPVSMRLANVAGADSLFASIGTGTGEVTLDRFDSGEGPWRSYATIPALARVARALMDCADADLPAVLNVALPEPYAMEALARAAGCAVAWRPAPEGAAAMVRLDTTRLQGIVALDRLSAEEIIAEWRRLESMA